jgi:hypothetical protein
VEPLDSTLLKDDDAFLEMVELLLWPLNLFVQRMYPLIYLTTGNINIIFFKFQRILYLSTCSLYVQDMEEWGHLFPLLDYSRMVYVGSAQKEYNENSTQH